MKHESPVAGDLERIVEWIADDLRAFRRSRIFITGGTGFVGTWLLEMLAWANTRLAADITALVLTRSPERFAAATPHLANAPGISFVRGDVRDLPEGLGIFDGVIHAATPASADLNENEPQLMLDTIVSGGRDVIALASQSGPIPFLFTSSGAVYGPQPDTLQHVGEEYSGAPDPLNPRSAYHEGKRVGELQCALAQKTAGLQPKIARLFALVGPYLPLGIHFAMGNFIQDAIAGKTIRVRGDGTTVRSYLYAADMCAWLWAIFARGEVLRPYNVGSEEATSTAELARRIAGMRPNPPQVDIMQKTVPGKAVDRYVPQTLRACKELGLSQWTPLDDAIARTIAFYETSAASA